MNLGNFIEDATVYHWFATTVNGEGAPPSGDFDPADVLILKNGTTAKATTNGITITTNAGGNDGVHVAVYDTSIDTGDAGFWEGGAEYAAYIKPDTETIGGVLFLAPPIQFSIENRAADVRAINGSTAAAIRHALAAGQLVPGTVDASPAPTPTSCAATDLPGAVDDFYKDAVLLVTSGALAGQRVAITDFTGATQVLTFDTLTSALTASDTFIIV